MQVNVLLLVSVQLSVAGPELATKVVELVCVIVSG